MNENGNKRREWIKTVAIIFLSVMLVLTFFSNTIMNYSLPEVSTQYIQNGSITAKIRGTGVIESGDPYEVSIKESRKVESVAVRTGDEVRKGDVLLYLADKDSAELEAAKEALELATENYELALLTAEITSQDISSAKENISASAYRQMISNAQAALKIAEDALKPAQDKVNELNQKIADCTAQLGFEDSQDSVAAQKLQQAEETVTVMLTAKAVAEEKKNQAETALNNKQNELTAKTAEAGAKQAELTAKQEAVEAAEDEDEKAGLQAEADKLAAELSDLQSQEAELTSAVEELSAKANTAKTEYETAVKNYDQAVANKNAAAQAVDNRTTNTTAVNVQASKAALEQQLYVAQKELTAAETDVAEKKEVLDNLIAKIGNVNNLQEKLDAIKKAQKLVDELEKDSLGATVVAEIDGTISSINITAGNTLEAGFPAITMQPAGKGCTLSFSVTNDQAKKLAVGDRADLVNAWRYDDVRAVLTAIKPDRTNPGQNKMLVFEITGDVLAGQTLSLSVGQKSANYDLIVPNSAIREDSNGKFVLTVEAKSSPLGNRYIATRTDVEVLASDERQSAITGALNGWEFVIINSTKPVEAGKQVRLSDN